MGKKSRAKWSLEDLKEDALKYKTRTSWARNSYGAYQSANSQGVMDICCQHMKYARTPSGFWTEEKILNIAKQFNSIKDWYNTNWDSYKAASVKGLLEKATAHITRPNKLVWTEEDVIQEAKKYKTRVEWQNSSTGSYSASLRKNFHEKATAHMQLAKKGRIIWTDEKIFAEAKKHKTRSEWFFSSYGSYDAAIKRGLLRKATAHMPKRSGISKKEQELFTIVKKKYPTAIPHFRQTFQLKDRKLRLELDAYIPELNMGIEFNGDYWHNEGFQRSWTKCAKTYHSLKKTLFKQKGINYINVAEGDWDKDKNKVINKVFHVLDIHGAA